MELLSRVSPKQSNLSRKHAARRCAVLAALAVLAAAAAQSTAARADEQTVMYIQPASTVTVTTPSNLTVRNLTFDASVSGLRAYVESIKATDAPLYAQLAPDVARLEERRSTAIMLAAAGVATGLGLGIYGIAGRDACPEPALGDPQFAAKSAAWGDCNANNGTRIMTYSLLGLGVMVAGTIASVATMPGRDDVLAFMNKNNGLAPEPLRLQLGYDPTSRLAYGGAAMTF